ncbi:hypothetical protein AB0D66_32840 [Streptomyces sp. NPDC048270]|uniref:hypothetical protein n=1 Tax=Streptomyces sp. NPDC048270 TaxID=3154615 RepID=UPI0033EE6D7F
MLTFEQQQVAADAKEELERLLMHNCESFRDCLNPSQVCVEIVRIMGESAYWRQPDAVNFANWILASEEYFYPETFIKFIFYCRGDLKGRESLEFPNRIDQLCTSLANSYAENYLFPAVREHVTAAGGRSVSWGDASVAWGYASIADGPIEYKEGLTDRVPVSLRDWNKSALHSIPQGEFRPFRLYVKPSFNLGKRRCLLVVNYDEAGAPTPESVDYDDMHKYWVACMGVLTVFHGDVKSRIRNRNLRSSGRVAVTFNKGSDVQAVNEVVVELGKLTTKKIDYTV